MLPSTRCFRATKSFHLEMVVLPYSKNVCIIRLRSIRRLINDRNEGHSHGCLYQIFLNNSHPFSQNVFAGHSCQSILQVYALAKAIFSDYLYRFKEVGCFLKVSPPVMFANLITKTISIAI